MQIYFNGDQKEIENGSTITALLQQFSLQPRHVAVEVNRELIPRGCHANHVLQPDDRLEVVTLVGGG